MGTLSVTSVLISLVRSSNSIAWRYIRRDFVKLAW